MEHEPGTQLNAEPQAERGEPGSRDTGSDEPAGGPADRKPGKLGAESATTIDPQSPQHEDSPEMLTGDGG